MDIKKRFKRFFTLSRNAEGFTLVELIVVIVILAILAGIALPAYGQYVTASEKAVERNQMAMYHNGFVVACVSEDATATGITLNFTSDGAEGGTFSGLTDVAAGDDEKEAAIVALFNSMFETYTFKYYGADAVEDAILNGVQESTEEETPTGTVKVTYKGWEFEIDAALAAALNKSTFKTIGSVKLLNMVDTVSDITAKLIDIEDDIFSPMFDTEYQNALFESLFDLKTEEGQMAYGALMGSFTSSEDYSKFLANSFVLNIAKASTTLDTSFIGEVGSAREIKAVVSDESNATAAQKTEAMAKLSMYYGIAQAYCAATGDTATQERMDAITASGNNFTGMTGILADLENNPKFQAYLKTQQYEDDKAGYQASMQIVDATANQSTDATLEVLKNGFADTDLKTALGQLMK